MHCPTPHLAIVQVSVRPVKCTAELARLMTAAGGVVSEGGGGVTVAPDAMFDNAETFGTSSEVFRAK